MDWNTWHPYYKQVAEDLALDVSKDHEIAEKLAIIVKRDFPKGFNEYLYRIKEKKVKNSWIFGAGPSLEMDFNVFKKYYHSETDLIVSVDGASLFLLENQIFPDVIFSDLDGSLTAILDCLQHGSFLVLHAHGDNFNVVTKFYPKIQMHNFLVTVQTKPSEPFLFNFGGFTDGDRAISGILEWFPTINIFLLGFTFGKLQGRYSKPTILKSHKEATEFKQKKLAFAKEFIKILANKYKNQIFNFSNPTESINGVSQEFLTN